MAHKGKFYPYAPPRDLAPVDAGDIAFPYPQRYCLEDSQWTIEDTLFSFVGLQISEPMVWDYSTGIFSWRWLFDHMGHEMDLTFSNVIDGKNPNTLQPTLVWLWDSVNQGPQTWFDNPWTDVQGGVMQVGFESSPTPPGESGFYSYFRPTYWAEMP